MRNTPRSLITAAALALSLGLRAPVRAQATDPEGYGDGYQSGAYGRVRAADGGATILRADSEKNEPDRATVNAPIFPGDTIRTDRDQRVEIQLAGGSIVRIDREAEVVFQSLPNPSAKFQDNTVVLLNSGTIRVTSRLAEKEEFRIDGRDGSVYLLGEGEFRIDTGTRAGMRVASIRGVAEVVGNEASVLVRGGTWTVVGAGAAPETPKAFNNFASDGFDRWCEARDDAYRSHDRYAQGGSEEQHDVPEEVRPYYSELSHQGNWLNDPDYGAVWAPSGVAAGWRPYVDGYWTYGPSGYFWVSAEPWGWAPYHYGCWQWLPHHGWCWVPGHVFAGAWVSWSWGSLYVGWAPLDFWGGPAWIGGPLYAGYYDPGCWTFVNYAHVYHADVHRYAVPIATVHDDLATATVVARAPRVDPRRNTTTQEWRGRSLHQVADDRAAHMRPIDPSHRPDQHLLDMQNHLLRRQAQPVTSTRISAAPGGSAGSVSVDRRTAFRERKILEDPRARQTQVGRPETQEGVRDFYQRMSRPRETRGPDTPDAPASSKRRDDARPQPRADAPPAARRPEQSSRRPDDIPHRIESPSPRYEAPTPRYEVPRGQPMPTPRAQQPPSRPMPRPEGRPQQPPRPDPRGHGHPREGEGHRGRR